MTNVFINLIFIVQAGGQTGNGSMILSIFVAVEECRQNRIIRLNPTSSRMYMPRPPDLLNHSDVNLSSQASVQPEMAQHFADLLLQYDKGRLCYLKRPCSDARRLIRKYLPDETPSTG